MILELVKGRGESDHKYHRVPAEALARHWRRYVGGGRLLYTRTAEGRSVLLQARAGRRGGDGGRPLAFELWK
jgi:hypothetical protein